jgi:hypothetical protein
MGLVTENRVAHVIKMRDCGVVENKRILDLAGISDHAIIANDHLVAHVRIVPNLAIATDDSRSSNHRALFDEGAFADENILADINLALATVLESRAEVSFEIGFDFFQGLPGKFASFENYSVLRLRKIEKIGWSEHG